MLQLQQGVPYFAYSENNRRERKLKLVEVEPLERNVEVAPRERNVRLKLYGTEGRRYMPTLQELAGLSIEWRAYEKAARKIKAAVLGWYTRMELLMFLPQHRLWERLRRVHWPKIRARVRRVMEADAEYVYRQTGVRPIL